MSRHSFFLLAALMAIGTVRAQSGHPYKLNWNVAGEELVYRSCGCADSCWVAEVRRIKQKQSIKATLRCDCEKLYFSEAKGVEKMVAEDCDAFNGDEKMEQIPKRIKELQSAEREE
ncbi:hypothetical protein GTP45_04220 [Pseudoduganella sp. FT55W]|uniref:Uncharacterized protein n=1 Tax=Duganella rivi TaxID=2666083 RepID=A0A7X4GP42_9BURK|nr:hypothetical protein [Duganella rivi]MYM66044.1 hypothetical protein [Duganella rivi]